MINYERNMNNQKKDNLIIGINLGDFGSTGNMMLNSLKYANTNGPFDVLACVPYETRKNQVVKTLSFEVNISKWKMRYYGLLRKMHLPIINDGNYYKEYTKRLIHIINNESKKYNKTIIHMHNMHMCKLNVCLFYKWLAKHKQYKVLYTLHDCWTFTGGCYCYNHINCREWQRKCKNCPQQLKYCPQQLNKRTRLLNKIDNLTLMPVSKWAYDEIKMSKLSGIRSIINYGETSIEPFKGQSTIKKKLNIDNKKILLAVSAYWNEWKGIKYLYEIASLLPDNYVLIIIGGNLKNYPHNIIHIPNIEDPGVLSEYYTIADAYISTTQSEQLGLTTCEAQICGTPVIGFGHCGSKETFIDGKTGIVVGNDNDIKKMIKAIIHVVEDKPFKIDDIIKSGNRFKKFEYSKRQLRIYLSLL